jgi:hypothetical protein
MATRQTFSCIPDLQLQKPSSFLSLLLPVPPYILHFLSAMGCLQSTSVTEKPKRRSTSDIPPPLNSPKKEETKSKSKENSEDPTPKRSTTTKPRRQSLGPLSPAEIQKRIEAPKETRTTNHDGLEIKFAWVSQRGYYPDGKLKY